MPNKGFTHSAETKSLMSRSHVGKKRAARTEEWKVNASAAQKGVPKPRVFEIGCRFCSETNPNKMVKDGRNHTGFARECKPCERKRIHIRVKDRQFKKAYGLSLADVEFMYQTQKGLCGMCGMAVVFPQNGKSGVDHCHKSKKVRAIIHHRCNIILGMANDEIAILDAAKSYLLRHS